MLIQNDDLEWRIRTFFDYWRQRHAFINNLDLSKHNHEANVLLWASLDALSNLWAKNIGEEQCNNKGIKKENKRLIFDAFLAHYGDELFQIVSLPDLWSRIDRGDVVVDQNPVRKLPEDACTFLGKIGGRLTPTQLDAKQTAQSRQISDDLRMDLIIAGTLEYCPTTNPKELEKWLMFSRYGAIAYKKMRSAYIHEGRSGSGSHSYNLHGSPTKPTYRGMYTTPPVIGFSVEFMLHVLNECITAFESEARHLEKYPVPT
ncbi:hypothetical protein [Chamaesiphon sp. OTE_8_metabat_110]|uniref:hypothetical protein n=1 Tax=Chamaesiphon sp. OTE_8_metabat_110 TaxID=2964696 RepID=UPI00286CD3F2|nr:hypothetical protein [Chamaesiphon sp. OTE_8_metabat_110]